MSLIVKVDLPDFLLLYFLLPNRQTSFYTTRRGSFKRNRVCWSVIRSKNKLEIAIFEHFICPVSLRRGTLRLSMNFFINKVCCAHSFTPLMHVIDEVKERAEESEGTELAETSLENSGVPLFEVTLAFSHHPIWQIEFLLACFQKLLHEIPERFNFCLEI